MQSTEWPSFFLPPPETPAVSILVAAAPAHPSLAAASPDELVPAETNSQRLFEANQCSLQNGL